MTYRFSHRNIGLLTAVAILGLIPAVSFAGVPGVRFPANTPFSTFAAQHNCPGGDSNTDLLPPCSIPYGHTYEEWAAFWEVWFLQLSAQPDGAGGDPDCSINQQGPVWFIVGGVTANCTVPAGKALFFPIINAECSDLEPPPFYGATPDDRRKCAEHIMDGSTHLAAQIDGRPIQGLERYNFTSPDIPFAVTDQNLFGIPCSPNAMCNGFSTNNGYYVMIAPLSPGIHTLQFTGTFQHRLTGGFTLNTTYSLTVR